MVELARHRNTACRRFAMVEVLAAIMILAVTASLLALNAAMERRRLRGLYSRAVAEQVLDGFREVLAAGAWRRFEDGEHEPRIESPAYEALPKGRTVLTVERAEREVRFSVSWRPDRPCGTGTVTKSAAVPRDSGSGRRAP